MATLSFHAGTEGKMTKQNLRKLVSHTFRKMEHEGKDVKPVHGNAEIDSDKTKFNVDVVFAGTSLGDAVEGRIAKHINRTVRKDAVLAREVIVQASPDVYEGLSEQDRIAKSEAFTRDALEWMRKEFGKPNVVGFSIHNDETNPHTHFVITPMRFAKEGKLKGQAVLSQKDFFKGPSDLKRQHREFRNFMNERGWNFDTENKYENVDGVDLHQYKKTAQAVEAKRSEQRVMQDELREQPDLRAKVEKEVSDELILSPEMRKKAIEKLTETPEVREEALEALREDLFDSVLLGERRALQEAQERLDAKLEALKQEREDIANERKRVAEQLAETDKQMKKVAKQRSEMEAKLVEARVRAIETVIEMDEAVSAIPVEHFARAKDATVELVDAYEAIAERDRGRSVKVGDSSRKLTNRDFVRDAVSEVNPKRTPSAKPTTSKEVDRGR